MDDDLNILKVFKDMNWKERAFSLVFIVGAILLAYRKRIGYPNSFEGGRELYYCLEECHSKFPQHNQIFMEESDLGSLKTKCESICYEKHS